MKRALLAGAALCALAAAPRQAHAIACANCVEEVTEVVRETLRAGQVLKQLDEARNMVREGEKIVGQGERAYRAVTGVRDLGSALYALDALGVQNPLPPDAPAMLDMLAGRRGGVGVLDALHRAAGTANRVFDPRDGTFRGDEMAANADSVAALQAVAARTYEANAGRLARLADIRARARAASDPKEVADLSLAVATVETDIHSQQAQLQSARLMFVGAQAARVQRAEEYESRCLRVVVAYFRQDGGGGSLNCPQTAGSGALVAGSGAAGGFSGGASGGSAAGGSALGTMLAQPWGEQAAQNAREAGINPAALAATCVIESGCRADAVAGGGSSASGPFQFVRDTWREQAQKVGVSTDLSARFDGDAASRAAANYLREGGQRLQQYGIDEPTVGQARLLYQFGGAGLSAATAPDSALVSTAMPAVSADTLAKNGITAGVTTMGQLRAGQRAKVGDAFDAPLFLRSNT